jgi:hypothetical protein
MLQLGNQSAPVEAPKEIETSVPKKKIKRAK